MKKIKMNLQNLDNAEVLTREQLKKVLGGTVGNTTHPIQTTVACVGKCWGGDHLGYSYNCEWQDWGDQKTCGCSDLSTPHQDCSVESGTAN